MARKPPASPPPPPPRPRYTAGMRPGALRAAILGAGPAGRAAHLVAQGAAPQRLGTDAAKQIVMQRLQQKLNAALIAAAAQPRTEAAEDAYLAALADYAQKDPRQAAGDCMYIIAGVSPVFMLDKQQDARFMAKAESWFLQHFDRCQKGHFSVIEYATGLISSQAGSFLFRQQLAQQVFVAAAQLPHELKDVSDDVINTLRATNHLTPEMAFALTDFMQAGRSPKPKRGASRPKARQKRPQNDG